MTLGASIAAYRASSSALDRRPLRTINPPGRVFCAIVTSY